MDFTANTVSGSMVYSKSSDPQFTPGSTILTVTLPSTSITKNTFETDAGTAQFNRIPNNGTSFGPMRIEGNFLAKQAAPLPAFMMARAQTATATPLICTAGL